MGLRCIPNKTLGVVALAAAVVVPIVQSLGYSSTATVSFALIALTFSLLTVVGGMAIVKHYFLMSQCLSLVLFGHITILGPTVNVYWPVQRTLKNMRLSFL